jgi:hypothetical protein
MPGRRQCVQRGERSKVKEDWQEVERKGCGRFGRKEGRYEEENNKGGKRKDEKAVNCSNSA